ncbi:hypothetical protein [Streptomyces flavidovirens]|uniref:hypothetical protein n=1 Tax=Streptomyces flavidovirens TaxID=67298 RepID=UPI00040DF2D2|nr:hypothetical protein [Streptomyces flavidovirens]
MRFVKAFPLSTEIVTGHSAVRRKDTRGAYGEDHDTRHDAKSKDGVAGTTKGDHPNG